MCSIKSNLTVQASDPTTRRLRQKDPGSSETLEQLGHTVSHVSENKAEQNMNQF